MEPIEQHGARFNQENMRRVFYVMCLTGIFMVVELFGGIWSGSLALLADAGHMMSDFIALVLAWLGFLLARKAADHYYSYGYSGFQVLASFVNGLTLILIAVWITIEAIQRMIQPVHVMDKPMLIIACIGLIVNIIGLYILHQGDHNNLNMRGAFLHVLGDLLGSVAAILASLGIMLTGWMFLDPILSIVVACIILKSAWSITRESARILMHAIPNGIDVELLKQGLIADIPKIVNVRHVHVWNFTAEQSLATLHLQLSSMECYDEVRHQAREYLKQNFGIDHATIEVESKTIES